MLWCQSAGFVLLIVLSWTNEWQGVSQALFGGGPHTRDWRDSALQTLIIIYVWAIVWGLSKRMADRLHYLGTFLRLCAWCRKVGQRGRWMQVEEYFADRKARDVIAAKPKEPAADTARKIDKQVQKAVDYLSTELAKNEPAEKK